jgi:hypothetical protein
MKVTVNIDCTPDEARQFLGLPDVKPMQQAVMARLEEQMMRSIENLSPEALLRTWLSLVPQGSDDLRKMMETFSAGLWGTGRGG